MSRKHAFSLVELLVVTAIIGLLIALLLSALSAAKRSAGRITCLNNLHQLNLATRMYVEDHQDALLLSPGAARTSTDFQLYKKYVKGYAGFTGQSGPSEKLFGCPSDTFYYSAGGGSGLYHNSGFRDQSFTDFTSYAFNGGNRNGTNFPGIAARRFSGVRAPSKTLLIFEAAAMTPFSWHKPQKVSGTYRFLNSMNTLSYVDGHVNYVKMYADMSSHSESWQQDPPEGYDYKWSGD